MSIVINTDAWVTLANPIHAVSDTIKEVWVCENSVLSKVYPAAPDAWWYITGTSGNYVFHICSQANIPASVVASGQIIDYGTRPGNRPYQTYRRDITSVVVDEAVSLNYGGVLFYDFSNAATFNNLDRLDTSAVTSMYGMFFGCSSATSFDVSRFNTASVTDMTGMFQRCSSVTSLDLRNFNTSSVTTMFAMFEDCSSLTSLYVSSFNTSLVTNMGNMFDGCSSLTTIDLRNFNTANVSTMYYMFRDCSSLTTLYVTSFDTARVTAMEEMFYNCSSITTLDISSFSNVLGPTINRMFFNCSALRTIYADAAKWTKPIANPYVFNNNDYLVGGSGTAYDANNRGGYYAQVDGGSSDPGYFTQR